MIDSLSNTQSCKVLVWKKLLPYTNSIRFHPRQNQVEIVWENFQVIFHTAFNHVAFCLFKEEHFFRLPEKYFRWWGGFVSLRRMNVWRCLRRSIMTSLDLSTWRIRSLCVWDWWCLSESKCRSMVGLNLCWGHNYKSSHSTAASKMYSIYDV